MITLAQVLFSQGFGSRRECEGLIAAGYVSLGGQVCDDPWHEVDTAGLEFGVQGQRWPFHAKALVMLHKPAGYECSQKPKHHPSVMSLLPAPLRRRGVQPVGRLDEDPTGLLLLTDDGTLIHRLTSPKHHVPKVYEVRCKHEVDAKQVEALPHSADSKNPPWKRVYSGAMSGTRPLSSWDSVVSRHILRYSAAMSKW